MRTSNETYARAAGALDHRDRYAVRCPAVLGGHDAQLRSCRHKRPCTHESVNGYAVSNFRKGGDVPALAHAVLARVTRVEVERMLLTY